MLNVFTMYRHFPIIAEDKGFLLVIYLHYCNHQKAGCPAFFIDFLGRRVCQSIREAEFVLADCATGVKVKYG